MYRTSDEPRFVKKKEALQRAFIQLALDKQTMKISIKELTNYANVNRMTFYSHYDEVDDILREFVDETVLAITAGGGGDEHLSIDDVFQRATDIMEENLDFYRLIARDDRFELCRAQFRQGFSDLFSHTLLPQGSSHNEESILLTDMLASAATYAYLDWLAGRYGNMSLGALVKRCEEFVVEHVNPSG